MVLSIPLPNSLGSKIHLFCLVKRFFKVLLELEKKNYRQNQLEVQYLVVMFSIARVGLVFIFLMEELFSFFRLDYDWSHLFFHEFIKVLFGITFSFIFSLPSCLVMLNFTFSMLVDFQISISFHLVVHGLPGVLV